MTAALIAAACVAVMVLAWALPRAGRTGRGAEEPAVDVFHDALTGLPNRAWLLDRLEQSVARAHRYGHQVAVLVLDADRFTAINNRMGHDWGDEVLKGASQRLVDLARTEDSVTRLDGDRFGILLDQIADANSPARVAKRIMDSFRHPIQVGGDDVIVSFCVGAATLADADATAEDLLRDATMAVDRAKQQGTGRFEAFDPEQGRRAIHRLNLEARMRHAPGDGEMVVHYQPEVSLNTGRILGMEALVRWCHPVHGLMAPDRFIPIAEETGLIVKVGRWVLEEACGTTADLHRRGLLPPEFRLSVNASVHELTEPGFLEHVARVLAGEGLAPRQLVVEVTETAQEMEDLAPVLEQLRIMGVGVAIDDFGTGYSSLSRLKALPASIVKIDQRFVRGLLDPANLAIVRSVTDLAGVLRLDVIAEGIETGYQLDLVRGAGCERGQGHYFSPAVPREELETLLAVGTLPLTSTTDGARSPSPI